MNYDSNLKSNEGGWLLSENKNNYFYENNKSKKTKTKRIIHR